MGPRQCRLETSVLSADLFAAQRIRAHMAHWSDSLLRFTQGAQVNRRDFLSRFPKAPKGWKRYTHTPTYQSLTRKRDGERLEVSVSFGHVEVSIEYGVPFTPKEWREISAFIQKCITLMQPEADSYVAPTGPRSSLSGAQLAQLWENALVERVNKDIYSTSPFYDALRDVTGFKP